LSALPLEEDFVSEKASKTEKKDEDVDEFGRRRPAPAPPTPQWPPSFETNGSDYVLDNRSGMFYEARSDFFYDPTTKLYYSQDRQAYFRQRRKEGKSVFDKVEQTVETFDAEKVHETDQKMKVPAISINLKTKALPKKAKKRKAESDSQTTAASSLPSSQQKEHAADISKWSERQAERKPTASALPKPQPKRDLTKISRTAKGEPICTLCQRKFATVDKLFYHEKVSELHKTNLAKQEAEERNVAEVQKAPVVETTKPAYVDRAQHRRILHGPETPVTVAPVPAAARTAVIATNTTVDPKDTLNESNIGNKLLQKLGWQQGKALGRGRSTAAAEVQQDWERIERLAGAHGKK
jgi:RNA-binding protein 5/10